MSWGLSSQAQGGYNYQVSAHFCQEQTDWSFYSVCNAGFVCIMHGAITTIVKET